MQKKLRIKNTKNKFRISAKNIYLTYSQVNKHITCHDILEVMKKKEFLPSFHYLIAKEFHASPEIPIESKLDSTVKTENVLHQQRAIHFHVLLTAKSKFNIRHANALDIAFQEHTYHGNYQAVRTPYKVVEYICKEGDYITDLSNIENGRLLDSRDILDRDVKLLGSAQALLNHSEASPKQALPSLSLTNTKKYYEQLHRLRQIVEADKIQLQTPFTLQDFNLSENLRAWVQNPNKTLFLTGESGVGKSAFSKAFFKEKNLKPLIVTHKEDFANLNSEHNSLLIDDANIHQIEETQLLAIFDNQVHKTFRVLFKTITKKPAMVQMILCNKQEFRKLKHTISQPRFMRRMHFENIKSPFVINLNVSINVNNNNFTSYPQAKTIAEVQQLEQQHITDTKQSINQADNEY